MIDVRVVIAMIRFTTCVCALDEFYYVYYCCVYALYIVLSLKGHSQQLLPIRQRSRGHVGVLLAVLYMYVHIGQVCKSWNLSPFVEAFYFVLICVCTLYMYVKQLVYVTMYYVHRL